MSAVFHLLAILVKVVLPEDMSTCLMRFSNVRIEVSSTRRKAYRIVLCHVTSRHVTPYMRHKNETSQTNRKRQGQRENTDLD